MQSLLFGGFPGRLAVAVAAGTLGATAAGLALAALYLFTLGFLGPVLSAIVTAGGALVLAGLLLLGGCICRAWHHHVHQGSGGRRSLGAEDIIGTVLQLLRRNPRQATAGALAIGIALGMSPKLRHAVSKLVEEFVESKSGE